jgi:predicted nucleotide-binding protein with TIR-like domain
MSLPIRTTVDDVKVVCKYLASKPTGATVAEAKKVIDPSYLDGRKLSALRQWGLVQSTDDGRFRVTDDGRLIGRDPDKNLGPVLRNVLRRVSPYQAILERVAHGDEDSLTANDVAHHWHEHFKEDASPTDSILNDQAVAFFQVVDGSGLGKLTIGRKGSPTRVDFTRQAVEEFAGLGGDGERVGAEDEDSYVSPSIPPVGRPSALGPTAPASDKVFITHGKNKNIVNQLKEIVTFGKFTPVVAEEQETTSKPVPDKVLDAMRSCFAGIIHVAGEQVLLDDAGNKIHKINDNVLIEIGAAMALYGRNFILLVEKGVQVPSNLQGLYECRYEGEKLDGDATMKLLKAFNEFRRA